MIHGSRQPPPLASSSYLTIIKNPTLVPQLLRSSHSLITAGPSETTRTCGVPTCVCHRDPDRRHGPHLYFTFRKDGKSCALYVPHEHATAARQAQAAWARFWEIGCALSDLNRTALQRDWQRSRS